jgi:antitoxin component of MazEF toxin-antitoxin module
MLKRNNTARPSGTSVAKWGNAPAIRIPKSVMSEANLREGDAVEFEVKSPGIIVVRASHSQPTLQDLIAGITPRNRP